MDKVIETWSVNTLWMKYLKLCPYIYTYRYIMNKCVFWKTFIDERKDDKCYDVLFVKIASFYFSHTYQRKELRDFSKEAIAKIEDKNAKQGTTQWKLYKLLECAIINVN